MERIYEKYAWVVLFALGLLWLVVGLSQVFNPEALLDNEAQHILGMPWSELKDSSSEATELARFLFGTIGVLKTSWSLLVIAITLTGFRRGEKWAWYTLCLVPILLVSSGLFRTWFFGDASEMLQSIPVVTISLVGLFLPYRKFFPR
jgi:hypothetical protein